MIEAARIDEIAARVVARGLDEQGLSVLRTEFPGIHFTYCLDDDLGMEKPVRQEIGFNLYLVDGSNHCLRFTRDPERATGVVLAAVTEDDEETA